MEKSKLWVLAYDLHWPKAHMPTVNALLDFLQHNQIAGFIFGGDQLDFECISHHTKGKPLYRVRAGYQRDINSFDERILTPVEATLAKETEKIYIIGNHERFEWDFIEEHPELEGALDHVANLNLQERGWKVIPLGGRYKLGKLNVIHGEVLSGLGNQAPIYTSRKAVSVYAGNVVAGHTHAPQMFTQVSPADHTQKWQGHILPILGNTNPSYLRNRPTAWVNGFGIVEVFGNGQFNIYQVVVIKGKFSFGGKIYGGK